LKYCLKKKKKPTGKERDQIKLEVSKEYGNNNKIGTLMDTIYDGEAKRNETGNL